MNIIFTVNSPHLDSQVDPRFGRCAYFLEINPETLEWKAYPNSGVSAPGGAGALAAQFVANQKAEVVISGDFGPTAYSALEAAGISMYLYGGNVTAKDALRQFKAGELQQVGAPTGPGKHHHG